MSAPVAMQFSVTGADGAARRGRLDFPRGSIETPAFMPVGTYGTVKAMTPEELESIGCEIVLANTFHLFLRPGLEVIEAHGGLHRFMHWRRPILTDSGGFQVWSLADRRKITEEGVRFRSPVDGAETFLSPEESMRIQRVLRSDVAMSFDECTAYPATEADARASMELSMRWAARGYREYHREDAPGTLFGIVQGGVHEALRLASLAALEDIGFAGLALGGLAVGESRDERETVLETLDAADAAGQAALFDGRRPPRGHTRGRLPRYRPIRLRDADAPRAQCPPVHAHRRSEYQERRAPAAYRSDRGRLPLLHLRELQPQLPAAPGQVQRDIGREAQYDP